MMPRYQRRAMGLHRHHRKCRSNGGSNKETNISLVCRDKHEAFHRLHRNNEAPAIAAELNRVWLDPAHKLVCVDTEDYERVLRFIQQLKAR